jgi:hypothetical protein
VFRKGHRLAEESLQKMIRSKQGVSSWNKGISQTEAVKQKISKTLKGRELSFETRKRMSEAQRARQTFLREQRVGSV